MEKKYYLVADRTQARIFSADSVGKPYVLIEKLEHPAGFLQAHDLESDKEGETFDSHGTGRHKLERDSDPVKTESRKFAATLAAHMLESQRLKKFASLVVCAEPGFLGLLREKFDAQLTKAVVAWETKDLHKTPDREIHNHI